MMVKQNIILTSMLALVIASPAMAGVGDTVNAENPAMCTVGDLGVSEGTANATAQFTINTYTCAAGTYLPDGDNWLTEDQGCTQCPAGSYCYGDTFTYSESSDQGIASCEDDFSGTTSDAGATSLSSCYYTATCPSSLTAANCDPHAATCTYANNAVTSGRYYPEDDISQVNCAMTFTCGTGYSKSTTQSTPTLPSTNGDSYEHHSHDNNNISMNGSSLSSGEWSTTWNGTGTMKGIASCNNIPANTNEWGFDNDASEWTLPANSNLASTSTTGRYCWCKPTSWTPSGGSEQLLSAAWVFSYDRVAASNCASNCAFRCALDVNGDADFRSALFGVVGASMQCVANTITLNWNNEDGTNFESGSCTYDESLMVPSTHPDKRGYTFTGWKFVSPSQN